MSGADKVLDKRAEYRLNRIKKEKEKQKEKHQNKIEKVDFLTVLNTKKEDNDGH